MNDTTCGEAFHCVGKNLGAHFLGSLGHFGHCHNIAEVFAIFRLKETLSEFNSLHLFNL